MADLPVRPADLASLAALFGPRQAGDPYPGYARWRAERPIARPHERLLVLSRYDDCEAVLADARFGHQDLEHPAASPLRAGSGAGRALGPGTRSFLWLNPPDHTRLRRLVSRAFTPSRVRDLAPRIDDLAGGLLRHIEERPGPFDLVQGLALPLPVMVISELLGIAPGDREQPVTWSATLARGLDPGFLVPEHERALQQQARDGFAAYLRGLLPARRRSPGDDLISALARVHDEDEALSEEELIATCILLLVAGHETTRSLIGNGVLALLQHPGELAKLRANPDLTGRTVEETLRYDSPIQFAGRLALRDAEVSGVAIPAGSSVLLLIGAANRDPGLCAEPDRFDASRDLHRHLAFGHGIHFCLGAPLARLEAEIAIRRLVPRLDHLEVARPVVWKPNTVLRGLQELWLQDRRASRPAAAAMPSAACSRSSSPRSPCPLSSAAPPTPSSVTQTRKVP